MAQFYIPYIGNKTSEFKKFYKFLKLDNIDIFIEPFCGSASTSAKLFFIYDDMKFVLNDIDYNLINFLKYVKYNDKKNLVPNITKILKYYNNHERFKKYQRQHDNTNKMNPSEYVAHRLLLSSPMGFFGAYKNGKIPTLKKFKKIIKYDEFIKSDRVKIMNKSYSIILNKYKKNSEAFIFLDPPYVDTDNTNYINDDEDYVLKINNDIFNFISDNNTKCKVALIVISNKYYKNKFKNYIRKTYSKTYAINNKKVKHLFITNYNLK